MSAHCVSERRAVVQGSPSNGYVGGTITWSEHETAWKAYAAKYGTRQSAECIHERGGFSYGELVDLLGREPTTWVSRRAHIDGPVQS